MRETLTCMTRHGVWRALGRSCAGRVVSTFSILLLLWGCASQPPHEAVLRIHDWKTGYVYVETPARVNSKLLFAWVHSLEKIPWNEYYHVDEHFNLILDEITFPAFGAGIPENKGHVTFVKDGLIHMKEIDQSFAELVWLNSHFSTRELALDGIQITRGSELPEHTRLRLVIEKTNKGDPNGGNEARQ